MHAGLVMALQTRLWIKEKTVMLVSDWTGQLAGERTAELHREAEQQRLVRLARTQRRRGKRRVWWGRHLLAGWLRASGEAVREPSTAPSTARSSATP